jgi:hypothetical protein
LTTQGVVTSGLTDGGRVYPHQHLLAARYRLGDVVEAGDVPRHATAQCGHAGRTATCVLPPRSGAAASPLLADEGAFEYG